MNETAQAALWAAALTGVVAYVFAALIWLAVEAGLIRLHPSRPFQAFVIATGWSLVAFYAAIGAVLVTTPSGPG